MSYDKNKITTDVKRTASYLLPEPGGQVVRELLDEIDNLKAALQKYEEVVKIEGLITITGEMKVWTILPHLTDELISNFKNNQSVIIYLKRKDEK